MGQHPPASACLGVRIQQILEIGPYEARSIACTWDGTSSGEAELVPRLEWYRPHVDYVYIDRDQWEGSRLASRDTVVGIDVGGTFIDYVVYRDGSPMVAYKHLSRPTDLAAALLEGLVIAAGEFNGSIVHGTTVATNALIQRRGSRCGLITTAGFADVIEIGRQDRPGLYQLSPQRPEPLVPRERRYEVSERVTSDGTRLTPLSKDEVERVVAQVVADDLEAVAICLLFSFMNPSHEATLQEALSRAKVGFVTASNEVVAEFREYERTTTTVANAYVSPLLADYLTQVDNAIASRGGVSRLEVMQSSGGLLSAQEARQNGVRMLLSGPAAGVAGAFALAQEHGIDRVITFDMGGTSTDVALCDRGIPKTTERVLDGVPIRVPTVDVETVGAGGGSIARVDSGGGLRVGPESTGADPGPACFGRGDIATVTDAQAVCGLLDPDTFLGGQLLLDMTRAKSAIADVAALAHLSIGQTAQGILRVAEASMEGAIRRISVERGHDPRDFVLVAFGGAGPLHACALADDLEIRTVLIPPYPGVTSAVGVARADMSRDFSQTVSGLSAGGIADAWARMEAQALAALPNGEVTRTAACRYEGQGYELEVAAEPKESLSMRFHEAHERRYGYSDLQRPVQLVTARITIRESRQLPLVGMTVQPAHRQVRFGKLLVGGTGRRLPIIDRSSLTPGAGQAGPVLVVQPDSATLIGIGWCGTAYSDGCLLLERQ